MTDVFTEGSTAVTTDTDLTSTLVGPDKKFKTVHDLAKGKLEADAFIEQIKSENSALREENNKKIDAETQLEKLRADLVAARQKSSEPKGNTSPELTTDAIEDIVQRSVTKIEQTKTATQNIAAANDSAAKHFGGEDKAKEAIRAKASELGLTVEEIKAIASKSPSAFSEMLGIKSVPAKPNVQDKLNKPDVNLNNQGSTGYTKVDSKEYFDSIRKENPKLYWSPKTQQEIFKSKKAGTYD